MLLPKPWGDPSNCERQVIVRRDPRGGVGVRPDVQATSEAALQQIVGSLLLMLAKRSAS